jgi:hypothetical protein
MADIGMRQSTGRHAAITVAVSPLLNLAPARSTGAILKHHTRIRPLGNSGISGTAILSLSQDRRSLDIECRLDGPAAVAIRLRRLARHAGWSADLPQDEDLLLIEIASTCSIAASAFTAGHFSLDHREEFQLFARTGELLDIGMCLSELRAGSVAGIAVAPARACGPARGGQAAYMHGRMVSEIEAAESSATAIAAARHVELATLYVRALRGTPPGAQ